MSWKDQCLTALEEEHLFQSPEHRTRFKELMDCFSSYPFFNRGLCKCMYLSAWDEEHFAIMLEMLNSMALGEERDTEDMRLHGDDLAEEHADGEYYVYQLSSAFLSGEDYSPGRPSNIPPEHRYIISRGLDAARVIDRLE